MIDCFVRTSSADLRRRGMGGNIDDDSRPATTTTFSGGGCGRQLLPLLIRETIRCNVLLLLLLMVRRGS
jgi:hypothetical protein